MLVCAGTGHPRSSAIRRPGRHYASCMFIGGLAGDLTRCMRDCPAALLLHEVWLIPLGAGVAQGGKGGGSGQRRGAGREGGWQGGPCNFTRCVLYKENLETQVLACPAPPRPAAASRHQGLLVWLPVLNKGVLLLYWVSARALARRLCAKQPEQVDG